MDMIFFIEKYDKKNGKNWNYYLNFLQFSVFLFFRQVSWPIIFCRLFCEHLDTLLAERTFSLELYAFVILKNLLTIFQFFSASCF